jgi:outer membrane protein assembly factor BamB
VIPDIHPERAVLEDFLTVLDLKSGQELESFSLLEVVRRSPYAFLLPSLLVEDLPAEGPVLDFLHTNHVEVFDGRLAERSPIYRKGNILLSCRNINAVFILDGETREIVWLWGPSNLTFQHHPSLLDNGNILIFDNGIEESRVIEVDPLSGQIVWSFQEEGFFSVSRGSAQRLPNGNTLITESDPGYVFEVTPEGEKVWIFANPDVSEDGKRSAIWRMTRIDPKELEFVPDGWK